MWLQGCTGILKILQGRDNAVTRLWQGYDKLVTIQSCEGIDNVDARLQWNCEYTTRL